MPGSGRAGEGAGARCQGCGLAAPSAPPPVSWAFGVQGGVRVWYCDACARENLRSIEAKLEDR